MGRPSRDDRPDSPPDGPEALLDACRAHPEWDDRRRDEQLDRLIIGHPPDRLRAAARDRLHDLGGGDGETVLRLVEALATPGLLDALADALIAQPDLVPDRAWNALAMLDDAGVLVRHPELAGRWEELNESLDDEGSLDQLAAQIEDDTEGLWLALHGLGAIEPDVRAEIIAGLSRTSNGPNLIEFLRLLSFAHDPATRVAAIEALIDSDPDLDDPRVVALWADIANGHPDPALSGHARRRIDPGAIGRAATTPRPTPRPVHSLVTAIDGHGQATVVLSSTIGPTRTSAAFLCDVRRGVREVFGQEVADSPLADVFLDELAAQSDRAYVLDLPGLAEGFLEGCLMLCGPETSPALRYWLERTVGPEVAPRPFPIPFPDWDPTTLGLDEMVAGAGLVLASCPTWIDSSPMTHDIAEEILLREGDSPPDPGRDAGAYRFLFEHQLCGQLELYRRSLLWMASFWQASGDHERGRLALALAAQLSDEQHAVAGHPFAVALTSQSLIAAQANLRAGIDPRRRRDAQS